MQRKFRLTKSSDFKRVRHTGKSYAHPLLVLITRSTPDQANRYGISAGRSVGNAVQRNRAKRLLREALRSLLPRIPSGWAFVLLARQSTAQARMPEVRLALLSLLQRARLLKEVGADDGK